MPSVDFLLVYCTSCGEQRKIKPERAYEQGAFEWPQLRALECPLCKGRMKPMPEYGSYSTTWPEGFWPMSSDVRWMN
jgi:hypothetical protein